MRSAPVLVAALLACSQPAAFDLNHDSRMDFILDDDLQGVYALISS